MRTVFAAFALLVLALTGSAVWYVNTPVEMLRTPAEFELPAGTHFRAVVRRLEEAGVRVGRWRFELLARMLKRTGEIKAGSYELATAPTPLELLDKLTRGDVTQAEIVFIEGWTLRQIRAALATHPQVRQDGATLDEPALLSRLGIAGTSGEGLFFPDTYLFSKGMSDLDILARAHRAMQRHLLEVWETRAPNLPYRSPYEALIMASIIEKETGRAEERATIAGVLVNRLRIGMRLQVDPTVIYGLGERFDGNLRRRDLLADGPYNTYLRAGLPPTPIAMPGLASLRAAVHPAATDALYYVARGDGTSQFSRTLDEHNRAVSKYQRGGR